MANRWSDFPHWDDELRQIVADSKGATWDEVAERLGAAVNSEFTADQVRNRAQRLKLVKPLPPVLPKPDGTKWDDFVASLRSAQKALPPPATAALTPVGTGTPETMVVLISDIHIGKLVEQSVVGRTFGYNQHTVTDRGLQLVEGILRLRKIQSTHAPLPHLELFFLGDGVDGADMRRGHSSRVDVNSVADQMSRLAAYFKYLVTTLAPYFPEGINLNWEFGNHGRIGDFGVNLPADNWDYVAGVVIREALRDFPLVRVNIHTQQYGIYQIGPLVAYAAHGNMVRGGLSSAGIKRHVANLENLHRQTFDLVLLGHFHTSELYTAGKTKVFMNGAWDGGDDFSVNQLISASDPVQWAFGVHPRRGLTWTYEIALAPQRRATPVFV